MTSIPREMDREIIQRYDDEQCRAAYGTEHDAETTRKALRRRAIDAFVGTDYSDEGSREILQRRALRALVGEVFGSK